MNCSSCGRSVDAWSGFCSSCGAPLSGASDGAAVTYAGFWLRFAAVFIDGLIITAVTFIPAVVLGLVVGVGIGATAGRSSSTQTAVGAAMGLATLLVYAFLLVGGWLYFALMESSARQATFGKSLCGIKVTDLNGNRISFARATGRHFAKLLSVFTFYIGYLMAAFTERKQALHDLVAGCLVDSKR